ncbi:hypothetical protein ABVT39_001816 [Epinephelus coioides]
MTPIVNVRNATGSTVDQQRRVQCGEPIPGVKALLESPPSTDSTNRDCPAFAGWASCGSWTSSATRIPFTGFTNLNHTACSPSVEERLPYQPSTVSTSSATEAVQATGSGVVELENHVLLHVLHVNTVGNQKFSATTFSSRLRQYARMQSNTTKTKLLSRLRFVSDKKRLCSQHGYKNTRIKFSSNPSRSANYTSNAKYGLQSYFRGVFETIALSQGTCVISTKPFTKVRNVSEDLSKALGKVAALVEIHVHLNRLCCELAQERCGMLTSQEKMCLVYLTETYFIRVKDRSHPKYWSGYREAVGVAFRERYHSNLSSFQDKVLTNYHLKNPEFVHLVPWLLDNPSELNDNLILAHKAYLREEATIEFDGLGYTEQTLRTALRKSLYPMVARTSSVNGSKRIEHSVARVLASNRQSLNTLGQGTDCYGYQDDSDDSEDDEVEDTSIMKA